MPAALAPGMQNWRKERQGSRGEDYRLSGVFTSHRSFHFQTVLINLGLEGGTGQAQEFGGLAAIAPGKVQGLLDNKAGKPVH